MKTVAAILVSILSIPACGDPAADDSAWLAKYRLADEHAAAVGAPLAAANTGFAARLFQAVAAGESGKNMMLSPLSVSIALAMTLNGASGEAYAEMRDTLGFSGMELDDINGQFHHLVKSLVAADKDLALEIANSLWMDEAFEPRVKAAFLEALSNSFDAEPFARDFGDPASVGVINDWVKANTGGRIETVLDEIGPDAVMYLINAIYFKAAWTKAFATKDTHDGTFTRGDGTEKTVRMMAYPKKQELFFHGAGYDDPDGYSAVRLPYGRGKIAFYAFQPASGTLDAFIAKMSGDGFSSYFTNLAPQEIMLTLPKFSFEYEILLVETLQALGMEKIFSTGSLTNLATDGEGLYVSEVLHKTFVAVDEAGTEAAAVTVVGVGEVSMPEGFYGTKPFVFAIRDDRSGTVLFLGKVEDP